MCKNKLPVSLCLDKIIILPFFWHPVLKALNIFFAAQFVYEQQKVRLGKTARHLT